jgi:hypothetical protein
MKESRKQFIIKAHKEACSTWKENIEKEFPKLFKTDKLETGKWYKTPGGTIFFSEEIIHNIKVSDITRLYGYGVDDEGDWRDSFWGDYNWELATDKEVEEALIKQAKKRGFKNGNYQCLSSPNWTITEVKDNYIFENNSLWMGVKGYSNCVFTNGKWAEIIKIITKEEAEKKLGKKIVN